MNRDRIPFVRHIHKGIGARSVSLAADGLFLFMLLFLLADALVSNWSLNIESDILFARIYGPLFYLNHSSVVVAICGIAIGRIILSRGDISRWVLALFATGSVHEMTLAFTDSLAGLKNVESVFSWSYVIFLSVFLGLALVFCHRWQKKALALAFILCIVMLLPISELMIGLHLAIGSSSVLGFSPTQYFLDPRTNFWEVINWFIPLSVWLVPKRFFT